MTTVDRPRVRLAGKALVHRALRSDRARQRAAGLSRRGVIPWVVAQRFPVPDEVTVVLPDGATFTHRRDAITHELFWLGLRGPEGASIRPFFDLARRARFVIDVGANTGLYTSVACAGRPDGRVLAIEPVARTAAQLRLNLAANGWTDRCDVQEVAISNRSGMASFHVPSESPFPVSASLNPLGFRGLPGGVIEVPVRTLDELLSSEDHVDLVKIDVEGFEDEVLEGMSGVLRRARPAIIVECTPEGNADAIDAILRGEGYEIFQLRGRGPERVARVRPDTELKYPNFMALPADDLSRWPLALHRSR